MFKRNIEKRLLCTALSLTLFFSLAASAAAAVPETAYVDNETALSTLLDRSDYADGSLYENPPTDVKTVRVGLKYGEGAVSEARFFNCSGEGFYIGCYDEQRNFVELTRTDESRLTLTAAANDQKWHILINKEYPSQEKAEIGAASYGGFAAEIEGEYRVLYGSYPSRGEAERIRDRYRLPGEAYTETRGNLRVLSSSGKILYSAAPDESSLALLPVSSGGKARTEYGDNRYYGGFECALYDGSLMNVINCVELEDYVKGVIPYEMSSDWPYEALRAQAVCARTYAVYNQNAYEEYGFDLTDNTESQVYRGTLEADKTTDEAVDSTAGQLVRYKGKVCEIYYFASDGGATEDGKNVFGSNKPYLTGKHDPFEQAVDYSMRSWTAWRSGADIAKRLQNKGYEIGTVTALEPELSDTGNVVAISFKDKKGTELRIEGRDCYTVLGLNNCRFTISQEGSDFCFTGSGWGHNCGMSQWGANAMAGVYGYDYEDIIRFYFSGAYIA